MWFYWRSVDVRPCTNLYLFRDGSVFRKRSNQLTQNPDVLLRACSNLTYETACWWLSADGSVFTWHSWIIRWAMLSDCLSVCVVMTWFTGCVARLCACVLYSCVSLWDFGADVLWPFHVLLRNCFSLGYVVQLWSCGSVSAQYWEHLTADQEVAGSDPPLNPFGWKHLLKAYNIVIMIVLLCCVAVDCGVLSCTVLWCSVLKCVVMRCVVLCCSLLWCIVLCDWSVNESGVISCCKTALWLHGRFSWDAG